MASGRASCLSLVLASLCIATVSADSQAPAQSIGVGQAKLTITTSDGTIMMRSQGSYPTQLLASPQVAPPQTIQVSFSLTGSVKPQQAFLALVHDASGAAAYAVAKAKKEGGYTASLPLSSLVQQIGKLAGPYTAQLLLGDPSVLEAVQWTLGPLEVVLPETGPAAVRTTRLQPINNQLPLIQHIFRPVQKQPPAAVSLLFTGLSMVPLAGVLLYVTSVLRANAKAWPKTGSTQLAGVLFHGLLAGMLGLYLLFWTKLNLAQTLPLVLGLGVLLALTGQRLLRGLSDARLASKKD